MWILQEEKRMWVKMINNFDADNTVGRKHCVDTKFD